MQYCRERRKQTCMQTPGGTIKKCTICDDGVTSLDRARPCGALHCVTVSINNQSDASCYCTSTECKFGLRKLRPVSLYSVYLIPLSVSLTCNDGTMIVWLWVHGWGVGGLRLTQDDAQLFTVDWPTTVPSTVVLLLKSVTGHRQSTSFIMHNVLLSRQSVTSDR